MRIAVDEGRRQLPQCARSRPLPRSHAPPPAWPPSGGQAGEPHPSSSAIDSAANKYVKPRNQHYRHLNAVLYRRSHTGGVIAKYALQEHAELGQQPLPPFGLEAYLAGSVHDDNFGYTLLL